MKDNKTYLPLLDIENVVSILNKISIFGGFSEKQLYFIFKLLKKVSYVANEFIFKQGEDASHIYIIRSGEVKIIIGADHTALEIVKFTTGQCFGETSVIGIQSHSANAVAVVNTELIVLPHHALLTIFEADKELFSMLILNIAREACRRLHKADEVLLHYVLDKERKAKVE